MNRRLNLNSDVGADELVQNLCTRGCARSPRATSEFRLKPTAQAAFSLIEAVISLAIIAFSVVGMLGLFPIGLKQASATILETHGTQLAQEIFATLRTPPFEKVNCFGTELDLASLNEGAAPVLLYATFPAYGAPSIGTEETDDSLYTVELRFDKITAVAANQVTLILSPCRQSSERLIFQSIVGTF